jgi:ABC-type nitrate/sulfonate/bicarbonate transport system substrate-binding protein
MLRALLACAALALAVCPRPAAADDALTLVDIVPSSFFEVLPDVAQHAGLFKAEHLNVTIQYAGNPSVAVQFVAAGKADVASINSDPIILGYDKGVRMTAFLSHSPRFQDVLGVLAASPIRTLAGFKGKVIGETSVGQPGEIFTRALLAGAGLSRSDYSFAPIGIGAQAIAAITSGKVDGLVQPFPQQRIYEVTGGLKFRYFFNPLLGDVSNSAWVTSPAIIQAKADVLRRFCRAMVEESILIRENPQLAAKWFVADAGGKVTDQAVADEIRLLDVTQDLLPAVDPTSKTIGLIPLRGVKLYTKFMYDSGLTAQLVPAEAVVTDQFIAYANDFDHPAFIARAKAMR